MGGLPACSKIIQKVKIIIKCLILIWLSSICYSLKDLDVEGEALLDLLISLDDPSGRITDWARFVSPCIGWSHVTCDHDRVIGLDLASVGFTGTISPSITNLKFLVSLQLQNNSLIGPLPDYLGSLTDLVNLNLASNQFNGSIPAAAWSQLTSLRYLGLQFNNLSGELPDDFGKLINLQDINLAGNNFSGSIPHNWAHLSNLTHLDMSLNDLISGDVPLQLLQVPTFNFTGTHLKLAAACSQHPCATSNSTTANTAVQRLKIEAAGLVVAVICASFVTLLSLGDPIFMY